MQIIERPCFALDTSLTLVKYSIARLKGDSWRLPADAWEDCMAIGDGRKRHVDTFDPVGAVAGGASPRVRAMIEPLHEPSARSGS